MTDNVKPFPFVTGVPGYHGYVPEDWSPPRINDRGLYIGEIIQSDNSSKKAIYSGSDGSQTSAFVVTTNGHDLALEFVFEGVFRNGHFSGKDYTKPGYDRILNVYTADEDNNAKERIFQGFLRTCRSGKKQRLIVPTPEGSERLIVENGIPDYYRNPRSFLFFYEMGPNIGGNNQYDFDDSRCPS
ncbi:MAG: hypothetical protein GDA41_00775 [Rhodospirillales bacterium]|nr:hypothetical protein [Rhodospirillales bacterium]